MKPSALLVVGMAVEFAAFFFALALCCAAARKPPRLDIPEDRDFEEPGEDICGLCGEPRADKIPHPVYWPGEQRPSSRYVHQACEDAEQGRAWWQLSEKQREQLLKNLK